MPLIAVLISLMLIALLSVSVIGRIQKRQQLRRIQQRRLRVQAEALIDIVNCLEQTLPNRMIGKHINDMVISLQQQILTLEDRNIEHAEAAIRKSELYSEELLNPSSRPSPSYQCESDSQIARTQVHLQEAMHLITQLAAQATINEAELDTYFVELRWAYLMVPAMSYIGQGDKSISIGQRFSAQAFYRKAQQLLMESMLQDPRRLKMIKELGEMIDGDRVSLSRNLHEAALGT